MRRLIRNARLRRERRRNVLRGAPRCSTIVGWKACALQTAVPQPTNKAQFMTTHDSEPPGDHDSPAAFDIDGALWEDYAARLCRLAQSRMPADLRQRVGPEDVVQSACRTFFRRAQDGKFQLNDADSLWNLLCAITLNKVRMQLRFHLRGRRSLNRETSLDARAEPASGGHSPPSDELTVFADQLRHLLSALTPVQQQVVQMKLDGKDSEEIAKALGCVERTVRRTMQEIRTRLKKQLVEGWDVP